MAREEARNVSEYISGVDYPARRNEILSAARRNDAPNDVLQRLESMPDREFERPDDIFEVLQSRTGGAQQSGASGRPQQGGGSQKGSTGQTQQGSRRTGTKQRSEGSRQGSEGSQKGNSGSQQKR